jgi:hypothetical protein
MKREPQTARSPNPVKYLVRNLRLHLLVLLREAFYLNENSNIPHTLTTPSERKLVKDRRIGVVRNTLSWSGFTERTLMLLG